MLKQMLLSPSDTKTFCQFESLDFGKVLAAAKNSAVTPPVVLLKALADALCRNANKKLSHDHKAMRTLSTINLGIAVDVDGNLRTAVGRAATPEYAT